MKLYTDLWKKKIETLETRAELSEKNYISLLKPNYYFLIKD